MTQTKINSPNFLNLDEIISEGDEVSFKLNGKSHRMTEATVQDFVNNTRLLQNLGVDGDIEKETQTIVKVIKSSFPTVNEDDLMQLKMKQLSSLMEFMRQHNGEQEVEDEIYKAAEEVGLEGNGQAQAVS